MSKTVTRSIHPGRAKQDIATKCIEMRFLWFIWMQDRPDLLFIEASLLHIRFTSNLTNINFLLRNKSFVQKGFQNWISTVSLRYQILLDTLIRFLITEFLLLPSVHQFHGQIQVCTENPPGVRIFTCHTKYFECHTKFFACHTKFLCCCKC